MHGARRKFKAEKVQSGQHQQQRVDRQNHLALHPVAVQVQPMHSDILPGEKAQRTANDQRRDHQHHIGVMGIPGKRNKAGIGSAQQIKPGVAKSRNRVKQGVKNAFWPKVGTEHRQKQHCARQLKKQGGAQDKAGKAHNATHLRRAGGFLQGAALHQRDPSAGQKRKGGGNGDHAQAADLDQQQDHALPKGRPVAAGVLHGKAGHAQGRGGGEQCLGKRRKAARPGRNGQHQKQCTQKINSGKPRNDHLKRGEPFFWQGKTKHSNSFRPKTKA